MSKKLRKKKNTDSWKKGDFIVDRSYNKTTVKYLYYNPPGSKYLYTVGSESKIGLGNSHEGFIPIRLDQHGPKYIDEYKKTDFPKVVYMLTKKEFLKRYNLRINGCTRI